ncbi:rhodanese-related sulfurtransferase [Puniceicoccales bacterium CK1056]|uniref:tRNA uridine(34) hydroxylase n=1 Tax=Oceanipulchritudo coccoides TaxID=2706888 RepID=A0A6B2LYQ8_9BACT|nr:rhodanese-related sulfurtransferase [Oceanipulchritudo coccoides]NDV61748.1 rhodanese-related sulfurtransferase [Oceanipulchritudo coccoides]
MTHYAVTAFYKFVDLKDLASLKSILETKGSELGILGTILLAEEGINSTIAGLPGKLDTFMAFLRSLEPFEDLEEKRSGSEGPPFYRFKVRLKKEIVTIGVPEADPRKAVGKYVDPQEWNNLIEDPNTVLIDTRNDYEVAMGKFKGAIDPETPSFRDFPKWAEEHLAKKPDQKIAMYCTGGIRCEKATSLLKQMGYRNVYHLKGGILKYLETIPPEQSTWEGSCFVFDQRVGLEHGLRASDYTLCHGCRNPLSDQDRDSPLYEPGVMCPHCANTLSEEKIARLRERQLQVRLAEARGDHHIGSLPNPEPFEENKDD